MRLKILLLSTLLAIPVMAQNAPPSEPITAQNAADLHVVAQIGAALPGELVWSPDGETLAVGTSDETLLYRPTASDQPIHRVEGSGDISFDQSGAVVTDAGRFDPTTGEFLGEAIGFSPSGRYTYTSEYDGTQIVVHLRDTETGETQEFATGQEQLYPTNNFVFSPDEQRLILLFSKYAFEGGSERRIITFQLWDVLNASLITSDMLTYDGFGQAQFNADGSVLSISSYYAFPQGRGNLSPDLRFYDGQTGELIESNDRATYYDTNVLFSPDGQLIARFIPLEGEILIGYGDSVFRLNATYLGRQMLGWTTNRLKPSANLPQKQAGTVEKPLPLATIRFSPDNRYLIAQTAEKPEDYIDARVPATLLIWEVASLHDGAAPILRVQLPDDANISGYMLTPDGESILVFFRFNYEARQWNGVLFRMGNGSLIREVDGSCYPIRFFNDSRRIIANCNDTFVIDDLFEDVETVRIESRFSNSSMSVNDEMIAYWDGGQVRVLETETLLPTAELNVIPDFLGRLTEFDITRGTAVFANNPTQCISVLSGEVCEFSSLDILTTPDEQYQIEFLTTSDNSPQTLTTMVIRDAVSGEFVQTIHPDGLVGLKAFSPDSSRLVITLKRQVDEVQNRYDCNHIVLVYDLTFLELTQPANLMRTTYLPFECVWSSFVGYYPIGMQFSGDNRLVSLDMRGSYSDPYTSIWWIELLDLDAISDNAAVAVIENNHLPYGVAVSESIFTHDSANLFVIDAPQVRNLPVQSRGFNVWSVESVLEGAHRSETFPPTPPMVPLLGATQLVLSRDGSVLAVRGTDVVGLWDVERLTAGEAEPLLMLDIEDVQEIGFSADGSTLFAASINRIFAYGL